MCNNFMLHQLRTSAFVSTRKALPESARLKFDKKRVEHGVATITEEKRCMFSLVYKISATQRDVLR